MKRSFLLMAAAIPAFLLAGCGEGYVAQPYSGTPYGDRTAGHGVEYVRASMLREKGPVIEAAMPEHEPIIIPPAPEPEPELTPIPAVIEDEDDGTDDLLQQGEILFDDLQRK